MCFIRWFCFVLYRLILIYSAKMCVPCSVFIFTVMLLLFFISFLVYDNHSIFFVGFSIDELNIY